MKFLITNKASVNVVDKNGMTALMKASGSHWYSREKSNDLEAVVQLLIENGADINATNGSGKTSLQIATRWGHERVMELLIENGAH